MADPPAEGTPRELGPLTLADLPPPPPDRTGWPWTEESSPWPAQAPSGGEWPRVSIVTPSYNQAPFLEETLRSVLLQGCPRLEYFVIDGGSNDGCREILERYAPWLSYWVSEADRGQSHAINKGFARATGRIVAWINSDDAFRPGAIRAAVETFLRHPRASLVYGCASDRDEHGVPMDRYKGRPFRLEDMLDGRNPVAQPSAFFSHEALTRVGWLEESMHFGMDYDLWVRLAASGEVVFVDEIWSDFRHYATSKSGTSWLPFLVDIDASLRRAFDGGLLPEPLQRLRRSALGQSALRVAIDSHWHGRDGQARAYVCRALSLNPALAWRGESRGLVWRALLGLAWKRRLKGLLGWGSAD